MSFIFTWHLAKALMIERVIYNKTCYLTSYLENPKENKQNAIHKKRKKTTHTPHKQTKE